VVLRRLDRPIRRFTRAKSLAAKLCLNPVSPQASISTPGLRIPCGSSSFLTARSEAAKSSGR
jgi:hypothetical protein